MNKFRESLLIKAFSFCIRVDNLIDDKLVNKDIALNVLHNAIQML